MTFQDLPLIDAILNTITTCCFAGWVQIKKGNREAHRKLMTAAFTVSALFLAGYLATSSRWGPKLFPMQGWPRVLYFRS
jgi:putative membrane protein